MSVAVSAPPPTRSAAVAPKMPIQRRPAVAAKPNGAAGAGAAKAAAQPTATSPPLSTPTSAGSPATSVGGSSSTPAASTSRRPGVSAPPAAFAVAGKDTSSSSGKVFAKPSKEWVLPERAKPGRKASTQEPDNKRQSQNRMSQRAHRARRTDYIQTLEERLRQYEADEIHSNVRLQEVARALKADNEKLKAEISSLGSALAAARKERESWIAERRSLTATVRGLRTQLEAVQHAGPTAHSPRLDDRLEYELAALTRSPVTTSSMSPLAGPRHQTSTVTPPTLPVNSAQRRPSTLSCPICPDPDPDCPCQRPASPAAMLPASLPPPRRNGADTTLAPARAFAGNSGAFISPKCGLCDLAPGACLCNPSEEDVKPIITRSPSPVPEDSPDCGLCTSESFCACRAGAAAAAASVSGSGDSDPAQSPARPAVALTATVAAPAVPLRLRARPVAKQSLWKLDNVPAGQSRAEAVCTGDPSNCDACRNDKFGQEFCGHLFGTPGADDVKPDVEPKKSCTGCTNGKCMQISALVDGPVPQSPVPVSAGTNSAPLVLACCGAPELCGHAAGCGTGEGDAEAAEENGGEDAEAHVEMRPDQAWKQLKAHPNARFTPLAVLADVVARRTFCEGPRVELSPPPDAHRLNEARAINASAGSNKRRLAVETSAVRDALKYLDSHAPKRRRV